jgi:hypoxanthine phosphoribosyltransferase
MIEREVLDWDRFGTGSRELAQVIADDGFRPDAILAIARGGLFLAGALSYALDVKSLHQINVEFYSGIDERLAAPVVLDPVPDPAGLAGLKLLIVDDVADTGGTLEVVREFYAGHLAESRTAVLYEKPPSVVKCDYVWHHTDRWINFPWSTEPPVVRAPGSTTAPGPRL